MHYFVSDIHLGSGNEAEQRRVERAFLDFLTEIEGDAESLFLVGDIFDFWFEYKEVVPKGFVRVLGRLAELSDKGVKIVFFTGNHDMWVGDYLSKECGIEVSTEPKVVEIEGKRLFVAHGDNMNIKWQLILRLMNTIFRSKWLRKMASWLIHPDHFIRFGKWWSGKSRKSHGGTQDIKVLQPLIDFATEQGERENIDYFIFGHMHYPADISAPQRILFMGDWHTKANYVALGNDGNIELKVQN